MTASYLHIKSTRHRFDSSNHDNPAGATEVSYLYDKERKVIPRII